MAWERTRRAIPAPRTKPAPQFSLLDHPFGLLGRNYVYEATKGRGRERVRPSKDDPARTTDRQRSRSWGGGRSHALLSRGVITKRRESNNFQAEPQRETPQGRRKEFERETHAREQEETLPLIADGLSQRPPIGQTALYRRDDRQKTLVTHNLPEKLRAFNDRIQGDWCGPPDRPFGDGRGGGGTAERYDERRSTDVDLLWLGSRTRETPTPRLPATQAERSTPHSTPAQPNPGTLPSPPTASSRSSHKTSDGFPA